MQPAPKMRKPPASSPHRSCIATYLLLDKDFRCFLAEAIYESKPTAAIKDFFAKNHWIKNHKQTPQDLHYDLSTTDWYREIRHRHRTLSAVAAEDSILSGDDLQNVPTVLTGKDGGNGEDLAPHYLRKAQAEIARKQWILARLDATRYGSAAEHQTTTAPTLGIVIMPPKESR